MTEKKSEKKKKYPKSETTPYNPWAVCTESVGRDDKEKYESCVKQVKEKNKKSHKKQKKSAEEKLMEKVAAIYDTDMVPVIEYLKSVGVDAAGIFNGLADLRKDLADVTFTSPDDIKAQQISSAVGQFQAALKNIISRETKAW